MFGLSSLLRFYTISNYDPKYSYTILNTLFLNIFTKQHFSQKYTVISNYESRNWNNCSLKKCISEHWIKTAPSKNAFQTMGV